MNSAPEDRRLGDYLLQELIAEGPLTSTWLAEQVSIRRPVLVEILRPGQAANAASFLADLRAKASLDHPLFASVYEAVSQPGLCFHARERLDGRTFAELIAAGETLEPAALNRLLHRIAEAHLHLEALGVEVDPVSADAFRLDANGGLRLENPALAGPRDPGRSREDIALLGALLPPLVAGGRPAANRVLTVLAWMRGEEPPMDIGWEQVRELSGQIERQLAAPAGERRALPRWILPAALAAAALALAFLWKPASSETTPVPAPQPPPPPLAVAAGDYPGPDGVEQTLPGFTLSARPVTVGEYAAFLDTLSVLAENRLEKTFDDPSQPPEKTGHLPDGWSRLQAGDPEAPVTGVDGWDAAAYAIWKKASLPSQEQWFAALSASRSSSVAEWTSTRAPNPANPLGETFWVLVKPGNGSPQREWVPDLSLRRPDLGFRIAWPAR